MEREGEKEGDEGRERGVCLHKYCPVQNYVVAQNSLKFMFFTSNPAN